MDPRGQASRLDGAEDAFAEAARLLAGRPDLLLAGFMTHMCVSSTARDAFNLGYRPTIVASATATRELPVPGGVPVPAATLQTATLAGIADLFTLVVGKPDDLPG
jgi:Isochorismatase family